MAKEYCLSYTASEINEKLGKVDKNATDIVQISEEISNLSKGMDLSSLTMTITPIDGANRLTLSDTTTSKYVDIPTVVLTNEQIATAVSTWLNEHPEATTTVEDGSITVAKFADDVYETFIGNQTVANAGKQLQIDNNGDVKPIEFWNKYDGIYSENLWNSETEIIDASITSSNGILTEGKTNYIASDYFPVIEDTYLISSAVTKGGAFYDENKKYISAFNPSDTTAVLAPKGAKWARLTFYNTIKNRAVYRAEKFLTKFPDDYIPTYKVKDTSLEKMIKLIASTSQYTIQRRDTGKGVYGGVEELNKYSKMFIVGKAAASSMEIIDVDDSSDWSKFGVKQVASVVANDPNTGCLQVYASLGSQNYLIPSQLGFEVGDTMYVGFHARCTSPDKYSWLDLDSKNGVPYVDNYKRLIITDKIEHFELAIPVTEDSVSSGIKFWLSNKDANPIEITNVYVTDKPNTKGHLFVDLKREKVLNLMRTDKFKDKSWLAVGDSITAFNYYTSALNNWYPFGTFTNAGINGSCMSKVGTATNGLCDRLDTELVESVTNADVMTIQYGTNDIRYVGSSISIGAIAEIGSSDFDKTTVYGAWQYSLEKILTYNPSIKLIVIIPPCWTNHTNWTLEEFQEVKTYITAIKEVCALYRVRVVDLDSLSNVNKYTYTILTPDGIHPSRTFGTQCASWISPAFEEIIFNDETQL